MPMDRARYPADWDAISKRIREERAAGRCECRGECATPHDSPGGRCEEVNRAPARGFRGRVVLTVAHLNHTPMDVREENLLALCQRCHLRYDRAHHAQTRARKREPVTTATPTLGTLVALHYAAGGSDKVWAGGVLATETNALVHTCWGRRGLRLSEKTDRMPSSQAAEAFLAKKAAEKRAKGYADVDYHEPRYGLLDTLARLLPPLASEAPAAGSQDDPVAQARTELGLVVSRPTAAPPDALEAALTDPAVGITEKVNGERCVVRWDEDALTAYNRLGKALPGLPHGAQALTAVGTPFVVDGEWLPNGYAMFDLLEQDGVSVRHLAYRQRLERLKGLVLRPGLVRDCGARLALTIADADGLALLDYEVAEAYKRALVKRVQEDGGEGVVLRALEGPSLPGNTPHERKVKFLAELDAFVLGVKETSRDASLRLGLVRAGTPNVIEIGSLRSGFTNASIEAVRERLKTESYPVLRVTFLPARTVGVRLVEPKSGPALFRDDKPWYDCSTEQLIDVFGEGRRAAIDQAEGLAA